MARTVSCSQNNLRIWYFQCFNCFRVYKSPIKLQSKWWMLPNARNEVARGIDRSKTKPAEARVANGFLVKVKEDKYRTFSSEMPIIYSQRLSDNLTFTKTAWLYGHVALEQIVMVPFDSCVHLGTSLLSASCNSQLADALMKRNKASLKMQIFKRWIAKLADKYSLLTRGWLPFWPKYMYVQGLVTKTLCAF